MNLIRFRRLVVLPLLLLVAVSISAQRRERKEEFDSEIAESVFRHQISQCAKIRTPSVFLLSVRGKDPSDELMMRFANDSATVKPRSALATAAARKQLTDHAVGKFAAVLSINKLTFVRPNTAQVDGSCGYSDGPENGYRYSLVRDKSRWIVKRANPTWFL